jgi:hypothetical protein
MDPLVLKRRRDVHPRLFRLLEKHQRIDELLRAAQRRPAADRVELDRLQDLKTRAKHLIYRSTLRPALA